MVKMMQKNCVMSALFLVEHKASNCEECIFHVRMIPDDKTEPFERCFFNCEYNNCPCREVSIPLMVSIESQLKNTTVVVGDTPPLEEVIETEINNEN